VPKHGVRSKVAVDRLAVLAAQLERAAIAATASAREAEERGMEGI
jgi:hypothetical protein